MTVTNVPAEQLIASVAKELKKEEAMKAPEWAAYAKTGVHKERPPQEEDWWYVRSAAILRTVNLRGPIGVAKLRTKYGGRKRRGHKTEHFMKGSGNIPRTILQQLEKAGYVQHVKKGVHHGRVTTGKAQSLLNKYGHDGRSSSTEGKKAAGNDASAKPASPRAESSGPADGNAGASDKASPDKGSA